MSLLESAINVPHRRFQVVCAIIMTTILLRYCVATNSYSGFNTPPMYGDYEAQRHWMEITVNVPVSQWYHQTKDNDLMYWGLDYPPLTAYVSWIFGKIAERVEPELVALHSSRGYETSSSKLFMRWTVLVCDFLFLFPPLMLLFLKSNPIELSLPKVSSLTLFLIHPAFILIDHGHFQYNNVSLGLVLYAMALLQRNCFVLGSICFCLSICFKQMSLYYAPAFFFYLLGLALRERHLLLVLKRVCILGVTVIATFAVVFLPFLTSQDQFLQVIHRMFPFSRGLFEDKVANFWCATSILIKWQQVFSSTALVRASLVLTLLALLPSGIDVLLRPTFLRFVYSMICSSFSFFLFSFQVHEKSILLPLLPLTALLAEAGDPFLRLFVPWIGIIATSSMYPLLSRDGLTGPYISLQLLFFLFSFSALNQQESTQTRNKRGSASKQRSDRLIRWSSLLIKLSLFGQVLVHVVSILLPYLPVQRFLNRYPDLVAYMFTEYAALHFMFAFAILFMHQLALPFSDDPSAAKKKS